jgi:hypothetical protein
LLTATGAAFVIVIVTVAEFEFVGNPRIVS